MYSKIVCGNSMDFSFLGSEERGEDGQAAGPAQWRRFSTLELASPTRRNLAPQIRLGARWINRIAAIEPADSRPGVEVRHSPHFHPTTTEFLAGGFGS